MDRPNADLAASRRRLLGALLATGAGLLTPLRRALAATPIQPLTLFAAASTRDVLQALKPLWELGGGASLRLVFAASSALARQIERGAPADLVLSADALWMRYLLERQLVVPESVGDLFGNTLVLVAPAAPGRYTATRSAIPARLTPGVDLRAALGAGRLALGDVRSVPAGRYAKAALVWLGAWDRLQGRLAMSENVRAALALVARGEVPLGLVYGSDAKAEPRVRVVSVFPEQAHPSIVYPLARVAGSRHRQADALLGFVRSAQAAEIFRDHGFLPVPR
ncbi:MAG: molybdate ABC transporter substrate-binding protein [Quisquiliibacterium sp.]